MKHLSKLVETIAKKKLLRIQYYEHFYYFRRCSSKGNIFRKKDATPWTQDVNWASYVRSVYVLCLRENSECNISAYNNNGYIRGLFLESGGLIFLHPYHLLISHFPFTTSVISNKSTINKFILQNTGSFISTWLWFKILNSMNQLAKIYCYFSNSSISIKNEIKLLILPISLIYIYIVRKCRYDNNALIHSAFSVGVSYVQHVKLWEISNLLSKKSSLTFYVNKSYRLTVPFTADCL